MLDKYKLNNKIIKQRIGEIPKEIKIYNYIRINNILENPENIFLTINLKKSIFKFNLFASLIIEEIEHPIDTYEEFIKKLSLLFGVDKNILKEDINEFIINLEKEALILGKY